MVVPNPLSAKQAEWGRKALCSAFQTLESVLHVTGQETRAWHKAGFKREHRKPSCQTSPCDAAHFHTSQHGNWMGRLREMEQRQWEELHWSCSLLWDCHGPCLPLPGPALCCILSQRLPTLIASCCHARGQKKKEGRRKAVILTGSAFKFLYREKMACTKLRLNNFAWWVFNT